MSDRSGWRPSWDEVRHAYRLAWAFNLRSSSRTTPALCQEDEYATMVGPLLDSLRPIRPVLGTFTGWPPRIGVAMKDVVESVDVILAAWGWTWMDCAEEERTAERKRREAVFHERWRRPVCEAALSWLATDPRSDEWFKDLETYAAIGQREGWKGKRLTREKALASFEAAYARLSDALQFGGVYPSFSILTEDQRGRFDRALNHISDCFRAEDPRNPLRPWRPEEQESKGVKATEETPALVNPSVARQSAASNPEEVLEQDFARRGAAKAAALVRLLRGRQSVSYEDAAETAWEDLYASDNAIKRMALGSLNSTVKKLYLPLRYYVCDRKIWVDRMKRTGQPGN
jgi:hypothetical protein